MPEGAVYVGRPTKWGNPWTAVGRWTAEDVTKLYADAFAGRLRWAARLMPDLSELRGHDLACWCPLDQPCHADVLLELANA